jgi:hypothetical protein
MKLYLFTKKQKQVEVILNFNIEALRPVESIVWNAAYCTWMCCLLYMEVHLITSQTNTHGLLQVWEHLNTMYVLFVCVFVCVGEWT